MTPASGPPIRELPSPNWDARPDGVPVDMLILHYTGMQSAQAALDRLRDPVARVSSHYVVDEDGAVWRLVAEAHRAWHAGVSCWRGHTALNDRSVGIEIVNPGHEWGYRCFPALQMAAVCELCLAILGRHPIPARNVVGHSDVAPDRKQDPGELFDWPGLAANGVGLWPEMTEDHEPGGRFPGTLRAGISDTLRAGISDTLRAGISDTLRAGISDTLRVGASDTLRVIGYADGDSAVTLRAFQRHWLPAAVTGRADAATLARLQAVRVALA